MNKPLALFVFALCICSMSGPSFANGMNDFRQSDPVRNVFCPARDYVTSGSPLATTLDVISKTFKSVDVVLSVIIGYEAERKKLDQGLGGTATMFQRLKPFFVGPMKAFGRTMTPFISGASKIVKKSELDSRVSTFYMKKFKPVKKYTWKPFSYTLKAVQVASLVLCKKATYKGVTIKQKNLEAAGAKMVALGKKYGPKVKAAMQRLKQINALLAPVSGVFKPMQSGLKPIETVAKQLKKGVSTMSTGLKPIFVSVKQLDGLLDKKNCITYGVKLKAKKGKIWKMKTKKVKYCFRFKNIIGKISKLSKTVQKPVNDLFNKTIKPVLNKITKAAAKKLKLGAINNQAQKLLAAQRAVDAMAKLKSLLSGLKADLTIFKQMAVEIDQIPLTK